MVDALLLAFGVPCLDDALAVDVDRTLIRSRVCRFRRATGRLWAFYGAVYDLVTLVKLRLELRPESETGQRPTDRAGFGFLDMAELELIGGASLVAGGAALVDAVLIDGGDGGAEDRDLRSEEHTSELQSRENLVC